MHLNQTVLACWSKAAFLFRLTSKITRLLALNPNSFERSSESDPGFDLTDENRIQDVDNLHRVHILLGVAP